MAGQEIINYKGKEIILNNVVGITDPKKGIEVFEKTKKIILLKPPKSVLLITDVTDAHYDKEAMEAMKQFSKDITPFVKASAAVGIEGLKKIVILTLSKLSARKINMFKTREEALEWIINQ